LGFIFSDCFCFSSFLDFLDLQAKHEVFVFFAVLISCCFSCFGVALSFWNERGKNNDAFIKIINESFPDKVLTYKIRKDISVSEASILGKPVIETAPNSRASLDFAQLTKELLSKM
jgi:hypothetical protein